MRSCIASTGKPRLGHRHDAGLGEAAGVDPQQAERPVRLPSAVRGRAWVEDPQVTRGLVERYVRMPEHHEIRAGEPAAHPHDTSGGGPAVVHHRHAETVQVQLRGLASPPSGHVRAVVVAEHGDQGRVFRQLGEHRRDADVTGVQDKVRVAQVRGHPGRGNPPAPGRMSISQNDNPHSTIMPGCGWDGAQSGAGYSTCRMSCSWMAGMREVSALLASAVAVLCWFLASATAPAAMSRRLASLRRRTRLLTLSVRSTANSKPTNRTIATARRSTGIFRLIVWVTFRIPSKAGADRIFQTVLMPLTRASAALWLL